MAVATSSIINWKLYLLLRIEKNIYSSSSGYKIETVQQINSYKAWN